MYTDIPMVVCAPTGSGKTVIFELAIIRLLMNSGTGPSKAKVVYSKSHADLVRIDMYQSITTQF